MQGKRLLFEEIAAYQDANRDTIYEWLTCINMPVRKIGCFLGVLSSQIGRGSNAAVVR